MDPASRSPDRGEGAEDDKEYDPDLKLESSDEEAEGAEDQLKAVLSQSAAVDDMLAGDPEVAVEEDEPDAPLNVDEVKQYSDGLHMIHISKLKWDAKCQWGQVRPLRESLVTEYFHALQRVQPRQPIRVLVRSMGDGVFINNLDPRFHIISLHR